MTRKSLLLLCGANGVIMLLGLPLFAIAQMAREAPPDWRALGWVCGLAGLIAAINMLVFAHLSDSHRPHIRKSQARSIDMVAR